MSTAHNAKLKIYEFEPDFQGQTACTNDSVYHCSKHWIPLLTTGAPKAKGHAEQSLLRTVKRPDGTTQATCKHRPPYTWKGGYAVPGDTKPGDASARGSPACGTSSRRAGRCFDTRLAR